MLVLSDLMDEAKCYEQLRAERWPNGVRCPHCKSISVVKNGHDSAQPACQHYRCDGCGRFFDDVTGTVMAGSPLPLTIWFVCLHMMALNVSNRQIAQELGLDPEEVHVMCTRLREAVQAKQHPLTLSGIVECD